MAVWLVRAGSHGEFEGKFIQDNKVYVTWEDLKTNLAKLPDRTALTEELTSLHPDAKPKTVSNWVSQIWPFVTEMQKGDLVILPLKTQRAIQVGEITGDYHFEPDGPSPFYHWRPVKWIAEAVPRGNFGKDLLNSFGAFMTICRIRRNNAEQRLEAMRRQDWRAETIKGVTTAPGTNRPESGEEDTDIDIEEVGRDQIARLIMARFKGHGLTRVVQAILEAQGYVTYRSPEGADGGADILAGTGPLGFGSPRLCVEVKSEDSPIDRPTVDKLLGAVQKFGAQEGLFVSWGGFRNNVAKEMASSFFRVRLWTQNELLEQLFAVYDRLDEDIKAELPLKRIWTVATQGEE